MMYNKKSLMISDDNII